MLVEFMPPAECIAGLNTGELCRYGALIKDAKTGNIVAHMKEASKLAQTVSGINPATLLSQGAQHYQLHNIQQSLNSLQLISSVGAVASVATLGVCAAGLMVINNKLKHLDAKLDEALGAIESVRVGVESANIKLDAISLARLRSAGEHLHLAQQTTDPERRKKLLEDACRLFVEQKNYYYTLFERHNYWLDPNLTIKQSTEMHSRFVACCLGQLYSEFLLGNWDTYEATWELVMAQMKQVENFDRKAVFRAKSDAALDTISIIGADRHALAQEVRDAEAIMVENHARLDSMLVEANYVRDNSLSPEQYLRAIDKVGENIVIIPIR